jgi:hypothetical protein
MDVSSQVVVLFFALIARRFYNTSRWARGIRRCGDLSPGLATEGVPPASSKSGIARGRSRAVPLFNSFA